MDMKLVEANALGLKLFLYQRFGFRYDHSNQDYTWKRKLHLIFLLPFSRFFKIIFISINSFV